MLPLWFWYTFTCVILIIILRYHWSRKKLYFLANSLNGPPAWPIVGNGLLFSCKEEELFERMSKIFEEYRSPIRFWLGPKLVVGLSTAPEIEKLLTSPHANDKDDIYRFLKVFNGLSLFTTNGHVWKKQRRYVTPFLGHKYMENYFKIMKDCSKIFAEKLALKMNEGTFDIEYYISRCANDIVTEVLMGFKPDAQNGKINYLVDQIHQSYILLHSRMLKLWLHPDFIFRLSSNGKKQMEVSNILRKHINKGIALLKAAKSQTKSNEEEGQYKSVLESLMNTKVKYSDFYADQNISDHIATLYSASEDTVGSICSYLFVLLGMYPGIQEKIISEIRSVLGDGVKDIEHKDLVELKYLDMCVKDVMRLFPIGPFILRKLKDDLQLGEHTLYKDCTVVLSYYNVHRNPEYWEKPNEFYPEHFLPEAVSARHSYAYLPFSAGPRSCPGKLFANTAIKTIAVAVLQRYSIEADGTLQSMKLKADISIRPVNGYKLRVKKLINK